MPLSTFQRAFRDQVRVPAEEGSENGVPDFDVKETPEGHVIEVDAGHVARREPRKIGINERVKPALTS